jgi:Na+/glutamate symporter
MRTFCSLILCITLFIGLVPRAQADMDARVKTVGVMAGYGAASGALLGIATLAFDDEAKNIFKGASLGLYAGIIFGSYIVVAHHLRKNSKPSTDTNYYEEESPYDGAGDAPSASPYEDGAAPQLFDNKIILDRVRDNLAKINPPTKNEVVMGIPLLALSF